MADLTSFDPPPPIDGWLLPLSAEEPCGPDLEYDPENLELQQTAAGKPETQFAAAEPPQWPMVLEQATALMQRTRDLRIALLWCRAKVNVDGYPAVPAALSLLHGLLEQHWDALHPLPDPDDGDTFARLSVLGSLDKTDGLLGDVRQCLLNPADRRLGGLRMRDVEIATDRLAPRADENPRTAGQVAGLLGDLPDAAELLRRHNAEARFCLQRLQRLIGERFSLDMGVDLKTFKGMLQAIETVLPKGEPEALADGEDGADALPVPGAGSAGRASGPMRVDSRQDAVRAIELVCAFLERAEPTNPAQFLLRRAARLIDKNFLQLVRDLAPDAVGDVARIMGIDPDRIDDENAGSH